MPNALTISGLRDLDISHIGQPDRILRRRRISRSPERSPDRSLRRNLNRNLSEIIDSAHYTNSVIKRLPLADAQTPTIGPTYPEGISS